MIDVAALRAVRLSKDLAYFCREFWHVVEPGTELLWNWHMDVICRHLELVVEGRHKHLLICVPPGTMKSLLVSVFLPAWEWLSNPSERTIFASNDESLAERDSMRCRQIIGSPEYREVLQLLDMAWGMSPTLDKKDHFANTSSGFRQSLTVNKPVTGKRANKIVVDDPLDAGEVTRFSQDVVREHLEDVYTWYTKVLSTRLNDLQRGHFIIIMQRLHEMDLVGRLLKSKDYHLLCLPMEYDPEIAHPDDPRRVPGELLHPARFPREVVESLKSEEQLGRIQAAAQLGQRPIPSEGGIFRDTFFGQRYDWQAPPDRSEFLLTCLSADCANKAKKKNDKSSFKLLGLHKSGYVYLLDSSSVRLEYAAMADHYYSLLLSWKPTMTVIEDAANGTALLSELEHLLGCDEKLLGLLSQRQQLVAASMRGRLAVVAEKPTEGKPVRAKASTVWYTPQNRVFLPDARCPWVESHIEQHLRFGSTEHDDEVDATAQGLKHIAVYAPERGDCNYAMASVREAPAQVAGMKKTDVEVRAEGRRSVNRFMLPPTAARGW